MSRFTQGGPMDFEYQNRTGPMDATSPFAQYSHRSSAFASQPDFSPRKKQGVPSSPSKSRTTSPNKPLPVPPTAAFSSLYTTPRKPNNNDFDDSSAGETPRSPEGRDDSDVTPEMRTLRTPASRFDHASKPHTTTGQGSPSRDKSKSLRRESIWSSFRKSLNSSGRGEVVRIDHSDKLSRGIEKRRRREVDRSFVRKRRHSMTDSEADCERSALSSPRKTSHGDRPYEMDEGKPHWMSALFTFIAQHPTVPHILSYYAQLFFNVFLLGGFAYFCYCFWSAVQTDVNKKSYEAMAEIMADMTVCTENYQKNACDSKTRPPALDSVCDNWSRCMSRSPESYGRARVSASTFAEIFNSFVEPISFKTMIFTLLIIFACFGVSNFAFGFFRRDALNANNQAHLYNYAQPPPPTPQRTVSGRDGHYFTPATSRRQANIEFEPMPSDGYDQAEGRKSPTRRLEY